MKKSFFSVFACLVLLVCSTPVFSQKSIDEIWDGLNFDMKVTTADELQSVNQEDSVSIRRVSDTKNGILMSYLLLNHSDDGAAHSWYLLTKVEITRGADGIVSAVTYTYSDPTVSLLGTEDIVSQMAFSKLNEYIITKLRANYGTREIKPGKVYERLSIRGKKKATFTLETLNKKDFSFSLHIVISKINS